MIKNVEVPDDYNALEPFFPLIRHLRGAAKTGGISIVSMKVLVNEFGYPLDLWTQPKVTRLNPRNKAHSSLAQLIDLLTLEED